VSAGRKAASNGSLYQRRTGSSPAPSRTDSQSPPHHLADGFEAVITTFPHFWLIEKFGEAGEVAELASSD
jgi:hypothetical protein